MVGTLTPERRGQIGLVQHLPVAAGHQRQEAAEGREVLDRRDRPDVPLQVGLQVRAEPQPRAARPRHRLGIAAAQQRDLRRLARRQREQLQHRRAARHGFRHALHQRRLLRAGQQPLARAPRLAVDARADEREHLRHVLHLVEDRGRLHGVEKSLRIGPKPRHDVRVFQQEVAGLGEQAPKQHVLPARRGPVSTTAGKPFTARSTCLSNSRLTYRMDENPKVSL